MSEILLISDLAGVGKVALSAMIPVLTQPSNNLSFLPTAVVSNNFDYGEAVVHDLTSFMEESITMWKKHDIQFDLITTGFLMSKKQVEAIEDLLENQKVRPYLIADPIMGDNGMLYPGLSADLVEGMRAIAPHADLMLPNLTEAALIVGEEENFHNIDEDGVKRWIDRLREKGTKSVLITSVELEDGKHYIYGYSAAEEEYFKVEYRMIPKEFAGTGDIFSALMTAEIVHNHPHSTLKEMAKRSADTISAILEIELERIQKLSVKNPTKEFSEVMVQNHLPRLTQSCQID